MFSFRPFRALAFIAMFAAPAMLAKEVTATLSQCALLSLGLSSDAAGHLVIATSPTFSAGVLTYTATVASTVTTLYTKPQQYDSSAEVFVQYGGGNSLLTSAGTTDGPYTLTQGSTNVLTISVTCSTRCLQQYKITITQSPPSGGGKAVGDPQFTGLRGQDYQVHGVAGEIYNIISDRHMQLNSRFVFLSSGQCAQIADASAPGGVRKQRTGCWTHPGSYLGSLALQTSGGDRLLMVAGTATEGFTSVQLNGRALALGDYAELRFTGSDSAAGSLNYTDTHTVQVQGGYYSLLVENSDRFVNQQLTVLDWDTVDSHGLLGQTWQAAPKKPGQVKEIEGMVDDYMITDRGLWSSQFTFNKFTAPVSA